MKIVHRIFARIMQLVIASNNKGKIHEIEKLVTGVELLSLADIGFTAEIPEPFQTFNENAHAKASAIHAFCGKNVFADDSGICVSALGGAPGVDSAHYSGTRSDELNLQKVLHELAGAGDRSAYYKAVICLIWNGEVHYFEGVCEGMIIKEKRGDGGFGYDPVFVPNGFLQTFAELPLSTKNEISHRGMAIGKMIRFIEAQRN
jgi:XTP/dITP diphosphohydrolase